MARSGIDLHPDTNVDFDVHVDVNVHVDYVPADGNVNVDMDGGIDVDVDDVDVHIDVDADVWYQSSDKTLSDYEEGYQTLFGEPLPTGVREEPQQSQEPRRQDGFGPTGHDYFRAEDDTTEVNVDVLRTPS